MASYFKSVEHLGGFIEGMLFRRDNAWSPKDGDELIVRTALGALLQLGQSKITVDDILMVLPKDFKIDGDRCNQAGTGTIISVIAQEVAKLSELYRFNLVFGDTEDNETVNSNVVESADDELENDYVKSIWYQFQQISVDQESFFDWLDKLPIKHEGWSGSGGSVRSLKFWYERYGTSLRHPCRFLWALLPDWDGKSPIALTDVKLDMITLQEQKEQGIRNLITNMVIPGMIKVFEHFNLPK